MRRLLAFLLEVLLPLADSTNHSGLYITSQLKKMTSYLEVVKKVDVVPYPHEAEYSEFKENVYVLLSDNSKFQLGYLTMPVLSALRQFPHYFNIDDANKIIKFDSSLGTIEEREEALQIVGKKWKSEELFDTLKGWRNEQYTIYGNCKTPYFRLERAMCPLFGVVMYGVHINGYVKTPDSGDYKLWVPRRAADKPTYPGMLDNTVAGGLGYPYGPLETCYKECYEEAGLDKEYISSNIKSCGVVSYLYQLEPKTYNSEKGLVQPEVEYIYDLEMDTDVIPDPVDHESEDFKLMPIDEVKERILNGEFKDNCAAIIIDFMIRHNIITPENEQNYLEINSHLHRFLPFPLRPN